MRISKTQSHAAPAWLKSILYFSILLGGTEFVIRAFAVPSYLLPAPSTVIAEMIRISPDLIYHLGITASEALLGFAVGNILAIFFGALICLVRPFREGVYPLLVAFQAVPIVALAPFVNMWFGTGLAGKVVLAALMCYFPATVISANGFAAVNRDALALLYSAGASEGDVFRILRVPSAIPAIFAALEVSATLSTIGAVVAEIAGSNKGIGYLIVRASYEFRTSTLFAALATISLATVAQFKVVHWLGMRLSSRFRFSYAMPLE